MSNLYNLTKSIHSDIDRINQKYSLKIDITYENSYHIINDGTDRIVGYQDVFDRIEAKMQTKNDFIPAIQVPQIRQILVGLKEVLDDFPRPYWISADNLCQKWLDGLNPLFDREPETVLAELLKILNNYV